MKKRFSFPYFLIALSFLFATACAGVAKQAEPGGVIQAQPPTASQTPPTPVSGHVAKIGDRVFRLEIADTPEERGKGLSGRTSLPVDTAMLFIFEEEIPWAFWMKDTLIPLDILWLDSKGTIVDIKTMQPEPGNADAQLTLYQPKAPALYALEMNAGLAKSYGFSPGMTVELELGIR